MLRLPVLIIAMVLVVSAATAQTVTIGTAQVGSLSNSVGNALGKVATDHGGLRMRVVPFGGGQQFLPLIGKKEVDIAIAGASDALFAYQGVADFNGNPSPSRHEHSPTDPIGDLHEARLTRERRRASGEIAVAGEDDELDDGGRDAENDELQRQRPIGIDELRQQRGKEHQRFRIRNLQRHAAGPRAPLPGRRRGNAVGRIPEPGAVDRSHAQVDQIGGAEVLDHVEGEPSS